MSTRKVTEPHSSLLSLVWSLFGTAEKGIVAASVPLKRLRWIDGNTTVAPAMQVGSEAAPYDSPERWLGTLTPAITFDDASTYEIGIVAPTAKDIWTPNPQTWTIPSCRSVIFYSFGSSVGNNGPAFMNPVITVDNGVAPAGVFAVAFSFVGMNVQGATVTLTDVPASPFTELQFAAVGTTGVFGGTLDYSGMNNADGLLVSSSGVQLAITPPASAAECFVLFVINQGEFLSGGLPTVWFSVAISDALLTLPGASQVTSFLGQAYIGAQFAAGGTFVSGAAVTFEACVFGAIAVVTAPSAAFDGASWNSFLAQGGTYGATVVQVVGGFMQGIVQGAPIATPAGNTVVLALNGVGATAGYTQGGNSYVATALAVATTTVHLLDGAGAGAEEGCTLCVTRTDATAGAILAVADATGGEFARITAPGSIVARYTGGAWVLLQMGTGAI